MQTDYLIIGAGASALAFLDTLLTETDAHVVVVDRRDAPGGHWNDAYPFVRLHQSATFYGVNSRKLETPLPAGRAPDPGRDNLSTRSEILHYFHDLMENTYLPTGRVTYLRMSEHLGNGVVRSRVTGQETQISVTKRIVQAGIAGDAATIPATHTPKFDVAPDATCVPVNDLPKRAPDFDHYCVLGAGKTGMDAANWLLEHGVDPESITWVRPNDYWLFCRENILPDPTLFTSTMQRFLRETELLGTAETVADFCLEMEKAGNWHRIDPDVTPTKFHAAVCSKNEVAQLRQITDVLRRGHVTRIDPGQITMVEGTAALPENTLYVDCTAAAGPIFEGKMPPVFDGDTINIYMVRPFQPLFSAALIAFLESTDLDDATRNACARMVNFHDTPAQYIQQTLISMMNQAAWSQVPQVKEWIDRSRLYAVNHIMPGLDPTDMKQMAMLGKFGPASKAAAAHIPTLLAAGT